MQRKMKRNWFKTYRNLCFAWCFAGIGMLVSPEGIAQESPGSNGPKPYKTPEKIAGSGFRTEVGQGDSKFPLAVVRGTPYEMGHHLGRLFSKEIQAFVPAALDGIGQELKLAPGVLNEVWSRTSSYGDDRLEQELAGLADPQGLQSR